MDPESVLNEFVGQPNTEETRQTIRSRLIDEIRDNGQTTINDFYSQWQHEAGQAFATRANNIVGRIVNNDADDVNTYAMSAAEYSRMVTMNYTADPSGLFVSNGSLRWEEPKMIEVGFVEVTANGGNNDRPIQVMTGKMRVPESNIRFFEDIEQHTIKSYLFDIAKKIITQPPQANANGVLFTLNSSGIGTNKWPVRKPAKAVDTIKELLDEAVSDIVQSTFRLQKKLRNFEYIRG